MTPHIRTIDRQPWRPRYYIAENGQAIPPSHFSAAQQAVPILVDLILTRIIFLAHTAPGRFDK